MRRLRGLQWPDLMAVALGVLFAGAAWSRSGAFVGLVCFVLVGVTAVALASLREVDRIAAQRDGAVEARMRDAIRAGRWEG